MAESNVDALLNVDDENESEYDLNKEEEDQLLRDEAVSINNDPDESEDIIELDLGMEFDEDELPEGKLLEIETNRQNKFVNERNISPQNIHTISPIEGLSMQSSVDANKGIKKINTNLKNTEKWKGRYKNNYRKIDKKIHINPHFRRNPQISGENQHWTNNHNSYHPPVPLNPWQNNLNNYPPQHQQHYFQVPCQSQNSLQQIPLNIIRQPPAYQNYQDNMYYNNPMLHNRETYVPQQQQTISPIQPLLTQQLVRQVPNNFIPVPMQQTAPPYIIYNPPQNVYQQPIVQPPVVPQRSFDGFKRNVELGKIKPQRLVPGEQKLQMGNGYGPRRKFKGCDNSRMNIRGNLQVVTTTAEVEKKETVVKEQPSIAPDPEIGVDEEYIAKMQKQKELREKIFREKEERRKQRLQNEGLTQEIQSKPLLPQQLQFKQVAKSGGEVKAADTDLPKTFLAERSVSIKEPLPLLPRVVIKNLAAGTKEVQLRGMCKGIGHIEKIEMFPDEGRAAIEFKEVASAHKFYSKFQRFMLNLSVIEVLLEAES